jgi:hypothetical protein
MWSVARIGFFPSVTGGFGESSDLFAAVKDKRKENRSEGDQNLGQEAACVGVEIGPAIAPPGQHQQQNDDRSQFAWRSAAICGTPLRAHGRHGCDASLSDELSKAAMLLLFSATVLVDAAGNKVRRPAIACWIDIGVGACYSIAPTGVRAGTADEAARIARAAMTVARVEISVRSYARVTSAVAFCGDLCGDL